MMLSTKATKLTIGYWTPFIWGMKCHSPCYSQPVKLFLSTQCYCILYHWGADIFSRFLCHLLHWPKQNKSKPLLMASRLLCIINKGIIIKKSFILVKWIKQETIYTPLFSTVFSKSWIIKCIIFNEEQTKDELAMVYQYNAHVTREAEDLIVMFANINQRIFICYFKFSLLYNIEDSRYQVGTTGDIAWVFFFFESSNKCFFCHSRECMSI